MTDFLSLSAEEQMFLCRHVGESLGIAPSIVEKDFWVCRALNALFANKELSPYLCFKGGTSLSKAYKIIRRFSEDIDMALSPKFFSVLENSDFPSHEMTQSQRAAKLRKFRPLYRQMMEEVLLPVIARELQAHELNQVSVKLEDLSQARDPFVLLIHYPSLFSQEGNDYIRPFVKVELSGRAQTEPSEVRLVDSYIGEEFSDFSIPSEVCTVSPYRTFWEKCFILHENNTRPLTHEEWGIKTRLARHYYDVAALIRAGYVDRELFFEVRNKRKLYHWQTWVDYDSISPEELNLIPDSSEHLAKWKKDYEKTSAMLFDDPEPFDSLIDTIRNLKNQHIS